MSLGGGVCIRNGFRLDYSFEEAVKSLLPICDTVTIADSDSDDGTGEFIREWAHREPKIVVCNFPWTDPRGTNAWYPTWVSYCRQHTRADHFIYLDADEVIGPESHAEILNAAATGSSLICNRLNFWRDPGHLIPKGHCLGTEVIRVGPQRFFFPSDYPDPRAKDICDAAKPSSVVIYHYGFLRHTEAFFRKAHAVQRIWSDSYDPRLEAAKSHQGHWADYPGLCDWQHLVEEYKGTHPEIIKEWLKAREHAI